MKPSYWIMGACAGIITIAALWYGEAHSNSATALAEPAASSAAAFAQAASAAALQALPDRQSAASTPSSTASGHTPVPASVSLAQHWIASGRVAAVPLQQSLPEAEAQFALGNVRMQVLGTVQVEERSDLRQPVVAVLTEDGRVLYRMAGVDIRATSAQAAAALLGQHPQLRDAVVTGAVIQAELDPAAMAAVFTALQQDPQVMGVQFQQLPLQRKGK